MAVSTRPYLDKLSETADSVRDRADIFSTRYDEGEYVEIGGSVYRVEEAQPPNLGEIMESFGRFLFMNDPFKIEDTYNFEEVDEEDLPADIEPLEEDPERIEWYE